MDPSPLNVIITSIINNRNVTRRLASGASEVMSKVSHWRSRPWEAVLYRRLHFLDPWLGPRGPQRSLRALNFTLKTLQYGCLRTPLDPSNQDLAFWVDSGQPGLWGLRGLVEVTLLFLFQTPTIFSLDTSDQDLTFWAESGQPGHWGLQGYA